MNTQALTCTITAGKVYLLTSGTRS